METVKALIARKPRVYLYASLLYVLGIVLLKWLLHPSLDALWFVIGGVLGVYFLDAAELFFALNPSPFRSIVFEALFAVVAFFVISSSSSAIGGGLVLSLFLQMLLWQIGEWKMLGNLSSWYRMVNASVTVASQKTILAVSAVVFALETILFVR